MLKKMLKKIYCIQLKKYYLINKMYKKAFVFCLHSQNQHAEYNRRIIFAIL